MLFEYNQQRVYIGNVDVVDPGNMCLRCISAGGTSFIFTKSSFGKVHMLKIGPILEDLPSLVDGFSVSYKKVDYKENLIQTEVEKYINDPRKKITIVEEILPEEAYSSIPNIIEIFQMQDSEA